MLPIPGSSIPRVLPPRNELRSRRRPSGNCVLQPLLPPLSRNIRRLLPLSDKIRGDFHFPSTFSHCFPWYRFVSPFCLPSFLVRVHYTPQSPGRSSGRPRDVCFVPGRPPPRESFGEPCKRRQRRDSDMADSKRPEQRCSPCAILKLLASSKSVLRGFEFREFSRSSDSRTAMTAGAQSGRGGRRRRQAHYFTSVAKVQEQA